MPSYKVVLFRSNGRPVREQVRPSKYSAKQLRDAWEEKYDDSYYVMIEPEASKPGKKSF